MELIYLLRVGNGDDVAYTAEAWSANATTTSLLNSSISGTSMSGGGGTATAHNNMAG